ncbi:MAG: hypothetical protein P1T08_06680 [Acidimicrobiia bacterium]|nr:hypothetical protein [Acidimicrobiia bacterium]
MRRILALAAVLTLAACGTWRAADPDGETEAAPGASTVVTAETDQVPLPIADETQPAGVVPDPAEEPTTTTTTTPTPIADQPSTTLPDLNLDLSELDVLMGELDGLLGNLGAAMNQTEGELKP